jgi:peptidoglycan/xylan/chitin deacetylase (PgdA/CDA1 family)
MYRAAALASLDSLDRWWGRAFAPATARTPHMVVALFHVVHRQREDARARALAPTQEVTLDDLRRFLEAMLRAGYTAASAQRLRESPSREAKHLLLTFDDGYYNNCWVLPVLEEFHAPAMFFISTSHVLLRKSFWWDAVARCLWRQGRSRTEIDATLRHLKTLPARAIEKRLQQNLGADALAPVGDADRPFDEAELRDFARARWVTLGNHTARHTILTRCSPAEAQEAMRQGKDQLEAMTGCRTDAIAYPNGDFSAAVLEGARATGHELGFTCVAKANRLPLDAGAKLTLGRHLIWGGADYDVLVPQLSAPCLPGTMMRNAVRKYMPGAAVRQFTRAGA